MSTPPLTSRRPYLLRAIHEWIVDNGQTPHIVVDATMSGVHVPQQHVRDGRIILNISMSAANALSLNNEAVRFRARFGGVSHEIHVPITAVLGIYARETGQGMIFSDNEPPSVTPPDKPTPPTPEGPTGGPKPGVERKSHLKVVK